MNYTDVDADRVLSTWTQIENDISGMRRTRDILRGQILSSLETCWKGQAKDTFTAQWNDFTTALGRFVREIEILNNELERAGKGYNKADGDAGRLVSSLPR